MVILNNWEVINLTYNDYYQQFKVQSRDTIAMPRIEKKRKHMRTIGSEGGRSKKLCDSPESGTSTLNANNKPQNLVANHSHNPHAKSDYSLNHLSSHHQNAEPSSSTTRGPSRSTLWRRAQKANEREKQRIAQEQQSLVDAEGNWEDIEKLVEEKWPMVAKEIRVTVLKKGMMILKLMLASFEMC